MARTKQTARKSTGGKAPRMQLATRSARMARSFFTSQQAAGSAVPAPFGFGSFGSQAAPAEKKIFVNCENTFAGFLFARPKATQPFQPAATLARIADFSMQEQALVGVVAPPPALVQGEQAQQGEQLQAPAPVPAPVPAPLPLYLRLDFSSSLDGALTSTTRPPVDVVLVVDVSGSMDSRFPDDTDGRNKLAVAKACMQRICEQLTPHDRVGVVRFSDTPEVVVAAKHADARHLKSLKSAVGKLSTIGGTNLALGLQGGFDELPAVDSADPHRLRRVFFLTDMESSAYDEQKVLEITSKYAAAPAGGIPPAAPAAAAEEDKEEEEDEDEDGPANGKKRRGTAAARTPKRGKKEPKPKNDKDEQSPAARAHVTVCGIGVDLSVATVERLSAIPGAKYMSVINAAEFTTTVAEGFAYDVTPIAFNIKLSLPAGVYFDKVFGSAELNSVTHASSMQVSAEFPEHPDAQGCVSGGLYLCRLALDDPTLTSTTLSVSWNDISGVEHSTSLPLVLPGPLASGQLVSPDCDVGLRKAVALTAYVSTLTKYVLEGAEEDEKTAGEDDDDDDDDDGGATGFGFASGGASHALMQQLQRFNARPGGSPFSFGAPPAPRARKAPVTVECPMEVFRTLHELKAEGIAELANESLLPAGTPDKVIKHYRPAALFRRLRTYLLSEMAACNDVTLSTDNQNILQTVTQIVELETAEIRKAFTLIRHAGGAVATTTGATKMGITDEEVPRGFVCPITLTLMKDPVTAADGHSYERKAIETWLAVKNTSPVTNLPLPHTHVVDNHALRQAIEDFVEAQKKKKMTKGKKKDEGGADAEDGAGAAGGADAAAAADTGADAAPAAMGKGRGKRVRKSAPASASVPATPAPAAAGASPAAASMPRRSGRSAKRTA